MYDGRSLRMQIPGQSALREVVRTYELTPARPRLARIFGISPLTSENRGWYKGALGELVVGETLERLSIEWDVLHAVPVGSEGVEVDHLVIGPGGVFSLDARNHSGQEIWVSGSTFTASGQQQPHIRHSLFAANRAAELLSRAAGFPVAVRPLLVIVDPKKLTRGTATGVDVVSSLDLEGWFQELPRTLSGDEVAAISDVADLGSTWNDLPESGQDSGQLYRDFAAIRVEVRSAIRRRVLWATGAFTVFYAGMCLSVAAFVATAVGG